MEEEDKVGVMVILETGLATAAAMTETPVVAAAAGFLPMVDYYLSQVQGRRDNVTALVEGTVEAVGATPEEFLEWIKEDKRHLALFDEVVEGAWSTFEQDRVEALKGVLADGFSNRARIDIDTLVVKALRDLDPPHVELLAYCSQAEVPMTTTIADLADDLPHLAGALAPTLSVLERHGCIRSIFPTSTRLPDQAPFRDVEEWWITRFGRECLAFLTGERDGL